MKKYNILFIFLIICSFSQAQMIIGDPTKASADQSSVLLDFEKNANRGLLLPTVSVISSNSTDGTLLLDATNATAARIKARINGVWVDLSTVDGNATSTRTITADETNSKLIIGAESSSADGVMVLESTNKAMVLPTVDNTDKIINPSPGMMVYVKNTITDKTALGVFNGSTWAFWSAN